MWYVNLNIRLALYLYVIGFILTMWYVNPKLKVGTGNKIQSFILTMWYVNNINKSYIFTLALKFYINYVIGKYVASLSIAL